MLRGLEELIEEQTGINTMTAEDPMTVRGHRNRTVCRVYERDEKEMIRDSLAAVNDISRQRHIPVLARRNGNTWKKLQDMWSTLSIRNEDNGYTVFNLDNEDGGS